MVLIALIFLISNPFSGVCTGVLGRWVGGWVGVAYIRGQADTRLKETTKLVGRRQMGTALFF